MNSPLLRPTDRTFSFARHALLEAFRISDCHGGKILLPEFICRDVLSAVHAVGASPCFYAVNKQLLPIELPQTEHVRAIIAINYFGIPQDLTTFREFCAKTGAVLIEDNAHGFLGSDDQGAMLGTRGDLGVTSFRKTIRVVDGAQLYVNAERFLVKLAPQLSARPTRLQVTFLVRRLASKIERRTGIRLFTGLQTVTRLVRKVRTGSSLPKSDPMSETLLPSVTEPSINSLSTVRSVDADQEIARRRELFSQVSRIVAEHEVQPIAAELSDGMSPYGFAFIADQNTASQVHKAVSHLHVETMSWPDLPTAVEVDTQHFYRNVWVVNFL